MWRHPIDRLADALREAERAVWITGAGLSVASGIAPYRKSADAVWSRFVTDWGTRRRFHDETLAWWRDFWMDFQKMSGPGVRPNPGHRAISQMVTGRTGHVVVTQNVDGLHAAAGLPAGQLIEIHGRHGLYRCTDVTCERFERPFRRIDLGVIERGEVPRCELCGEKVRPLVLLFDEHYESHPFFASARAFEALHQAQVVIFVGTSFAVGATELALEVTHRRRVPTFNVNIDSFDAVDPLHWRYDQVVDVRGRAEEILPRVSTQLAPIPKRRWWSRALRR